MKIHFNPPLHRRHFSTIITNFHMKSSEWDKEETEKNNNNWNYNLRQLTFLSWYSSEFNIRVKTAHRKSHKFYSFFSVVFFFAFGKSKENFTLETFASARSMEGEGMGACFIVQKYFTNNYFREDFVGPFCVAFLCSFSVFCFGCNAKKRTIHGKCKWYYCHACCILIFNYVK